jgi:hypothetical protein
MRVFQGFLGNKETRHFLQWEQGNKGTKQKGIDLVPRLSSNEERSGKSLGTWLQGNMYYLKHE